MPAFFARCVSLFAIVATINFATFALGDKVVDEDKAIVLIDYSPPFTSPTGGEVFAAGQAATIAWNNAELYPPENVTQSADIMLGYTEEGSASLHLFWTLAKDVPLYAPNPDSIEVKLPANLTTRETYFFVLLGSTSNRSPQFTILGGQDDDASTGSSKSRMI
ncbi:hypothetical protein OIO90_005016 [Microbotryomycetes sp. JL221]|nr:hypothetical protein OIO90_005016 [Microbotryomycetes sp. JL221]